MQETIYNDFVQNITNSSYALLLILIIGFTFFSILKKYYESERKKIQLRNRTLYISCLIYAFLLARIWVEGFTQLFAILGFISAALVIANKETIMSFIGWLIITWRELFTEGDLVQIDKNKGFVKSIGILYITIEETIDQSGYLKTGRILKIPNNQIILHTTVNFSYDTKPILQKHELYFKPNCNVVFLKTSLNNIISDVIKEANLSRIQDSPKLTKKQKAIDETKYYVSLSLKSIPELKIEAIIYFYCYSEEYENVKINFIAKLLELVNKNESIIC